MTILVTGGTGFVGAAVVRQLLAAGESVRALARPTSNRRNLDNLPIEIVEGDLTDSLSLRRAVMGVTAVFHIAADYRLWVPDPRTMEQVNITGTRNLLRAAAEAGVMRIVYTSSVATLGLNTSGTPADEDTPVSLTDMIGPYKRSKFLAEAEIKRLVAAEALPVVIVNPSMPVGPRDIKPTPTGRLIRAAVTGRMPAYVETGLNLVHVDDVAAGHWLAWRNGSIGERYILGGENMSLYDMLTTIAILVNRKPPSIQLPYGIAFSLAVLAELIASLVGSEPFATVSGVRMAKKKMFFSSAKACRVLGYTARPAIEGLRDAVAWFRAEGAIRQ
ncbi:Dihydroflavonol-4-reductase [invertebrate metagenome]|uniref:Dihydroflavonol-4-reductase n=1 Tax=invertebrate metagenome TaxID=1711999 RepID=A0A484HB98_9ZZZZ